MPKKSTKSRSKRVTLAHKHKVIKKVKEHMRKKAKELRKKGGRVKPPKDPGIPAAWPFKEQLLQEMEFEKHRRETAVAARKEAAKARRAERRAAPDDDDAMGDQEEEPDAVGDLAARAAAEGDAFDGAARPPRAAGGPEADADRSRRAFYREFVKVVDASDVVIQVLDARDPLACRAPEVERFVRSRGPEKRLVLLLNKVDLVPRHAAEAWLAYFREELPCVAFKCATAGGAGGAARKAARERAEPKRDVGKPARERPGAVAAADAAALSGGAAACAGADMLLGLLKNYARSRSLKTSITVGIVGLPNVGKSSLINSLCRGRAPAATGATPGLTRAAQEVILDKHVKLLDSPGIVFATSDAPASDAVAALRNAIRVEKLEDPLPPVGEILKRAAPEALVALYGIARFAGCDDFLRAVAAKRGKLRRGGVPDALAAARMVLGDWNAGKIPFFTLPPARAGAAHAAAEVVAAFAADFDPAAMNAVVLEEEAAEGEEFVELGAADNMALDTGLAALGAAVAAAPVGEADAMEDDRVGLGAAQAAAAATARGKADARAANERLYGEAGQHNPKAARAAKKALKKEAPQRRAAAAAGGGDSDFEDWGVAGRAAAAGGEDSDAMDDE